MNLVGISLAQIFPHPWRLECPKHGAKTVLINIRQHGNSHPGNRSHDAQEIPDNQSCAISSLKVVEQQNNDFVRDDNGTLSSLVVTSLQDSLQPFGSICAMTVSMHSVCSSSPSPSWITTL